MHTHTFSRQLAISFLTVFNRISKKKLYDGLSCPVNLIIMALYGLGPSGTVFIQSFVGWLLLNSWLQVPEERSQGISFEHCDIYTPDGCRLLMRDTTLELQEGGVHAPRLQQNGN